jgi:HSP20 family protein
MAQEKNTQTTAQQGQPQSSGQNRQMATRRPTQQQGLARRPDWMPSLWAGGPFAVMQRLAEEMDQLFNTAFSDFGMGQQGRLATNRRNIPGGLQTQWAPPIDVFERDNQFMVRAELPGLNTNDIEIEVMDNMLTISGERREEHEEKQEGYRVSERHYGRFFRTIPLPEGVEAEQVQAKFQNGVLEVTMPIPRQAQRGRRVEIQEGSSKGEQQSGQQA